MISRATVPERPARRWHRWLGWIVGPWLLLMAITGLALGLWPEAAAAVDPGTGLRSARPAAEAHEFLHALHASLALEGPGYALTLFLASAALLSLLLGVRLGWPRRWRDALSPRLPDAPKARWYLAHRACGWWLVVLLLPTVASGGLLAAAEVLPWQATRLAPPMASTAVPVAPATAAWAASEALRLGTAERLHRVRLHDGRVEVVTRARWGLAAGQDRRWWFDAAERRLLRQDPPARGSSVEGSLGVLFAWHSGHWAGAWAWAAVAAVALGASALAGSGWRLWWLRRAAP